MKYSTFSSETLLFLALFLILILSPFFKSLLERFDSSLYYPSTPSQPIAPENRATRKALQIKTCPNPQPGVPLYAEHEYSYEGDIKLGMHETVTLSCDQRQITFSGAVNQIVNVADSSEYARYTKGDSTGFADVSHGSWVAAFKDYNFDGFNDFSSISSYGLDVQDYVVFLFDPKKNQFIYSRELSSLSNLGIGPGKNEISQSFCDHNPNNSGCYVSTYKWVNGKLTKIISNQLE